MSTSEGTIRLRLPGREVPSAAQPKAHTDIAQFYNITEEKTVTVGVSLRGSPVETVRHEARPEDVVELQYEGGLCQWIRVDQLRDDLRQRSGSPTRGADEDGELLIPPDLGSPATRGGPELLLEALKILKIDPVASIADLSVRGVISLFEDSVKPGPGLYLLKNPETVVRQITDANELDSRSPYLLFLHGTASSLKGSFGGLATSSDDEEEPVPPDDWEALQDWYAGRILGLQHKTLSVSPVQNALEAAKLLPAGAQLHLVSHSRGGLIGELLCLNELPGAYLNAFAKVPDDVDGDTLKDLQEIRKEEAGRIRELAAELARKRFVVQRFVRVACPARGTVLASKRLDLYLSVLLNLIGLIPVLKVSTLYTLLKAVTLETARRRANPRQLPGIEAMMPESPLINLLNQPDLRSIADLAVISGDLAPQGVWQRLKFLAVDLFYLQPNDLVVNTSAMYGGMERRTAASYFFNKGPHVNHFRYFRNTGTRSLLRKWLQAGQGAKVEGFRQFLPAQTEFVADTRRAEDTQQPRAIVFVVPDVFGTQLEDDAGLIWASVSGMGKRGLDRLLGEEGRVRPGQLIPDLYSPLVNALQQQFRVETIPYDWRRGLDDAAGTIKNRLQECLKENAWKDQPIHFVAHGAGGLAVLRLAADREIWKPVESRNGRLVFLGVPVRGCAALGLLRDKTSPLNRVLRMADHQSETAPEVVFQRSKLIEDLLPGSPEVPTLEELAKLRNVFAVLGKADRTVYRVNEEGRRVYSSDGDGLVLSSESWIEGIPTFQVNAPHAMLCRHELLAQSVLSLLSNGSAPNLPKASVTATAEAIAVPGDELLFFPTQEDLLDAALVGKPSSQFDEIQRPVTLEVSHGHLRQAKFPVMVGHYEEDMIVNAEKAVDGLLDKRLTQRFNMAVYPGQIGTSEIILRPSSSPPGALVIGLGEVGELTPEKLRRSVRAAAVRYALMLAEEAQTTPTGPRTANFSAVLMGTYGQGSVRDAVSAIVHGALDANRQLADQKLDDQVRIEQIEIIELYQDMAAEASHEMHLLAERLNGDATAGAVIAVAPRVRVLGGGRASRPVNPYAQGWWRRIKISRRAPRPGETEAPDGLEYTILTDRARAEDYVRGTQAQVLAPLLQKARETTWDEQVSTVLFQLLVPRNLRSYTQDRVNLVLVVDEEAAQYPWELLAQKTRAGVEPLATQCGLLRQLRSSTLERRLPPASPKNALIIGDTQSGWSNLPGALAEAKSVHVRLQGLYDPKLLEKAEGTAIVSALLSQEYRIVHLAGHGNFDGKNPKESGMKIGPDQWLTPDILDGMLAAPDLVFVNCCYLGGVQGAIEGTPSPHLAASFAVKLMNLGTKAVVAAGWAVNDAAARTFAERFYRRMTEGVRFGDAVLEARQRTKDLHPHSNTWGAYQCYGNPDFRLELTQQTGLDRARRRFVAREEILQSVRDIAAQAADGVRDDLLKQLTELRNETPAEWRDGELLSAFGSAYGELKDFDQAISAYRQALADEKGAAPLRAAQQIGNLLDRSAKNAKDKQRQEKLRKEALDWLIKIAPVADTAESAALRGGYYKRNGNFSDALEAYERSFQMRGAAFDDELFYPGLNAAALAYIVGGKDATAWTRRIAECEQAAIRRRETARDFWAKAGVVDAALMKHLWADTLAANHDQIADAYIALANGGGGTPKDWESVLGQIEFLRDRLPQDHPAQAPLRAILEKISRLFK